MGIETATYISDFVTTNPVGSDAAPTLGNHARLLKSVLRSTFTGISGAVTATHTELNYLHGLTSSFQTQLNSKFSLNVTQINANNQTLSRKNFQVVVINGSNIVVILPAAPVAGDMILLVGNSAADNIIQTNTGQWWLYVGSPIGTQVTVLQYAVTAVIATAANIWQPSTWE